MERTELFQHVRGLIGYLFDPSASFVSLNIVSVIVFVTWLVFFIKMRFIENIRQPWIHLSTFFVYASTLALSLKLKFELLEMEFYEETFYGIGIAFMAFSILFLYLHHNSICLTHDIEKNLRYTGFLTGVMIILTSGRVSVKSLYNYMRDSSEFLPSYIYNISKWYLVAYDTIFMLLLLFSIYFLFSNMIHENYLIYLRTDNKIHKHFAANALVLLIIESLSIIGYLMFVFTWNIKLIDALIIQILIISFYFEVYMLAWIFSDSRESININIYGILVTDANGTIIASKIFKPYDKLLVEKEMMLTFHNTVENLIKSMIFTRSSLKYLQGEDLVILSVFKSSFNVYCWANKQSEYCYLALKNLADSLEKELKHVNHESHITSLLLEKFIKKHFYFYKKRLT